MELLLTLIVAHLFADFPLQTNIIARLKAESWRGVLIHVMIHLAVTSLLISSAVSYWPLLLGIGICHFVIDNVKAALWSKTSSTLSFLIDQSLHLLSLTALAYLSIQLWAIPPHSVLPDTLLIPTITAAFIPALMVFSWIVVTNHPRNQIQQSAVLQWIRTEILICEQGFGIAIILLVLLMMANQEFGSILQLAQRW